MGIFRHHQLGGQSQSEPQTVEPPDLRLVAHKPYEPSLSEGHLNTAGYGFGQLQSMAAYGLGLDRNDPYGTLMLLLKGEWAAARNVWGAIVPDIPGLKDNQPDRQALLDWLDAAPGPRRRPHHARRHGRQNQGGYRAGRHATWPKS